MYRNETAKVGAVTGPLADALNWASAESSVFEEALGGNEAALKAFNKAIADGENVEDAFTAALGEMSTEQERSSAITATLNGLYSEAGEEYNQMTASQQAARDATNSMEQAQAALGAALEPVTTAWTNMKAQALEWLVNTGLPGLQSGWKWIQDNIPGIVALIGTLTVAWLTFGGAQKIVDTWNKVVAASQAALNAVQAANPIGLIVLAIAALVTAFILLWNNCEGFRNFWIGLWDGIKEASQAVADWFVQAWQDTVDFFTGLWSGLQKAVDVVISWLKKNWQGLLLFIVNPVAGVFKLLYDNCGGFRDFVDKVISSVKKFFSDLWSNIVNGAKKGWEGVTNAFSAVTTFFKDIFDSGLEAIKKVFSTIGEFFGNVWTNITSAFSNVGTWFSEKFTEAKTKITGVFSNIKEDFLDIGDNIVQGIWSGISDGYEWIKGKIEDWVGNVVDFFKELLGIESPSKVFRDEVGAMISLGLAKGIEDEADKPMEALYDIYDRMQSFIDKKQKEREKSVADHLRTIANIHKKKGTDIEELYKQYQTDLAKDNADRLALKEKFNEDLANLEAKAADDVAKAWEDINAIIEGKMQNLVSVGQKFSEDTQKIWDDLGKSIADLQANYDSQLASRTESIANSLGLWDKAEKNKANGKELTMNLASQVELLDDYNKAIQKIEERGLDEAFVNMLKGLGVDATGEIEALAKMTDSQLTNYVKLWEEKNALAKEAAIEELEPLKAETLAKIDELSNEAVSKYAELRGKYEEEAALLMAGLKEDMLATGQAGYDELVAQIDDYTSAGADLMDGVTAGIMEKSPALVEAVTSAVRRAIAAAKAEAGIHSPSRVMKTEIGHNLAEGVKVGWADRMAKVKDSVATEMQGLTARVRAVVMADNAKMAQGVGFRDIGISEVAQAVGMQTAGINSLASEYRNNTSRNVEIPLVLDGRELGRAIVDLGATETDRRGVSLAFA